MGSGFWSIERFLRVQEDGSCHEPSGRDPGPVEGQRPTRTEARGVVMSIHGRDVCVCVDGRQGRLRQMNTTRSVLKYDYRPTPDRKE